MPEPTELHPTEPATRFRLPKNLTTLLAIAAASLVLWFGGILTPTTTVTITPAECAPAASPTPKVTTFTY